MQLAYVLVSSAASSCGGVTVLQGTVPPSGCVSALSRSLAMVLETLGIAVNLIWYPVLSDQMY